MLFSLPLLSQGLSLCARLGEIFNATKAGWLLQWETQGAVSSGLEVKLIPILGHNLTF